MKFLSWLLKLYPHAWRERYEIEMIALLEEHNVTLFTLFDLLLGALDARLNPFFRRQNALSSIERTSRLRIAHSTIFWVFPVFWMCWIAFLSDLSDALWDPLTRAHPLLAIANGVMGIGFSVAIFSVAITGLIIALTTARYAFTVPYKVLYLLPLVCFLGVCGNYLLLLTVSSRLVNWVFLLSLLGSLLATSLVIARGKISKEMLSLSLAPTAIATLGMVVQLVAIAIWGIVLLSMSGTITNPSWSANNWPVSLITGFVVMAFLTIFALRTLVRGLLALTSTIEPLKEESQQYMPPPLQ